MTTLVAAILLVTPAQAGAQSSGEEDGGGEAAGEAATTPWSGWWWPASDAAGPALFSPGGPLDKYDSYVAATSGESPHTRDWERQELYFPDSAWAGHCNGFAAAALLEPEPIGPIGILGITFSTGDLKGLLVDYHFADAAAWSFGDDSDLSPAKFHRVLLRWLQDSEKGFVLTYELGDGQVWSYPVYRFESVWVADGDLWDVTTTVWMADMNVAPSFVGTKPYPSAAGKTFTYTLNGDPLNPAAGVWTGSSSGGSLAHPARVWYPDGAKRNVNRGDLVSPGLDRETIANILVGSDGSDLRAFLRP